KKSSFKPNFVFLGQLLEHQDLKYSSKRNYTVQNKLFINLNQTTNTESNQALIYTNKQPSKPTTTIKNKKTLKTTFPLASQTSRAHTPLIIKNDSKSKLYAPLKLPSNDNSQP
ncbi:MAG: hypothetical protein ACI9E5_000428, partial [Candidatus Omnitrophota bacterium]